MFLSYYTNPEYILLNWFIEGSLSVTISSESHQGSGETVLVCMQPRLVYCVICGLQDLVQLFLLALRI